MNAAQFALIEKRLRANKPKRSKAKAKPAIGTIPSSVNGGFKAGKRKRGNSLLKRTAITQASVIPLQVRNNESGLIIADNIRTVVYTRKPS